jgi:hypothetical protein
MKKFYTSSAMDTLQAIGIIVGFYALMALVVFMVK